MLTNHRIFVLVLAIACSALAGCVSRSGEHEVAGWWYDVCPDEDGMLTEGGARNDDRNLCIRYGRCTNGRNAGGSNARAGAGRK